MYTLCFLMCFLSFSNSFLFDTNTPGQSGSSITDDRYDGLLKLFMDERKAMLQLQYVYQQQQNITSLSGLTERMDKMEASNTRLLSIQGQAIADMTLKFAKLEQMYNDVKQNNIQLQQELNIAQNRTKELENEITSLKQVTTINQLQTLSNLHQQVHDLQRDVYSLTANSQARGQDLMAMYNELSENTQKLNLLDTSLNTLRLNLTVQIEEIHNNTIENEKYEGFTAFGIGSGIKSLGATLLFPDIKSTFGLYNLSTFKSTGIFTCEKEGIYLISITVMSCAYHDAHYIVYKNNVPFPYYIMGIYAATYCHSACGTFVTQLNVNDNVYVKTDTVGMEVFDRWSSFTVFKLK